MNLLVARLALGAGVTIRLRRGNVRIAFAQMNAVVGGFAQNVETLGRFRAQGALVGADLVLTPELSLMGYPPEDLLLKEGFIEASVQALFDLSKSDNLPPILVGTVMPDGTNGVTLAPSSDGRDAVRDFDERRAVPTSPTYWSHAVTPRVSWRWPRSDCCPTTTSLTSAATFTPASGPRSIINVSGVAVGMLVCEDVWTRQGAGGRVGAAGRDVAGGGERFALRAGRREEREAMLRRARS